MAFSYIRLILIFSLGFQAFVSDTVSGNQVILDVSQVIRDAVGNKQSAWDALEVIVSTSKDKDSEVILFYETDFMIQPGETLQKVGMILTDLQEKDTNLRLKLLVSFRNASFNDFISVPEHADALEALKKFSSIFVGISFHSGIVGNLCIQNVNYSETFIANSKQSTPNIAAKIGYSVTIGNTQCDSHTEMIKQADYVIINLPLKVNDNIFVESFGIFKENMKKIFDSIHTDESKESFANKTVYYRVSLNATINRVAIYSTLNVQNETEGFSLIDDKHLLEEASPKLSKDNEITSKKYEQLLTAYIYELIASTNDDVKIILTCTHEYPSSVYTAGLSKWMPTNTKIIPFLSSLIVSDITKENNASSIFAANILLEDMATAGFRTVMINGQIWKKMAYREEYLKQCPGYRVTKCRPTEVIYNMDNYHPFEPPLKDHIKLMRHFGGMRMEALNFPHGLYDQLKRVLNGFHEATKADTKSTTGHILCQTWSGNIHDDCNQGCVDTIAGRHIFGCSSNSSHTSGFVWNVTVNLDEKIEKFVDNTMKRLDAFVIARRLPLISSKGRNIILNIKVIFTGAETDQLSSSTSFYCNNLSKRVSQCYETLLTWARIHDFTVIIEQVGDERDIGNPLALKRLSTTDSNDPLYELMKVVPIFVRQSYNQSIVFGSYTEGLYPCITKASSIIGFSFDHDFSGVTLNLNLRQHNDSLLTAEDVQMLLLFALKKFHLIEIILESRHFERLSQAVSESTNFLKRLQQNKIIVSERKIYLQIQAPFSKDDQKQLNSTVLALEEVDFDVYVTLPAGMIDDIVQFARKFNYYQVGTEHSNCTDLAYDIIYKGSTEAKENLREISFLVCPMTAIPANNHDKEEMQNYFNSHLYLRKLLQQAYPNLRQVYFRLQSTFRGNSSEEQAANLLLFLADFNTYAQHYRIHYFLLPAFAKENNTDMETSIWSIKNYDKLADPCVFNDTFAETMKEETWRPEFRNEEETSERNAVKIAGLSAEIFWVLIVICLIITTATAGIFVKRKLDQGFLSEKEIGEFKFGRQETLKEASRFFRRKKRFSGSIFDGLVFQMEYAMAKEDLDMSSKVIVAEGKYSTVYRVKLKDSPEEVAVKVSKKNCSKEIFKGMLSEVKLLCYLGDHRNIVSFVGCYKKEINRGVLWVVMEYRDGGNLLNYLRGRSANERDEQSFHELVRFSHEIASGMEHIAGQNIVHGDLCAENVLMNRYNKCKIKCFGLSRKQQEYYVHMKRTHMEKIAAWRWMAPESLKKLEFTRHSDVWSFGVTLWEIFNLGVIPHSGILRASKLIEEAENGIHLKIPDYATEEIYSIMLECWRIEPDRRPDFSYLLKHFTNWMPQSTEKSSKE